MKKLILIFGLFFLHHGVYAQTNNTFENEISQQEADNFRNVFKINLPSLIIGTYSFQYEFFPVSFMSLAIGYKFTPKRGMIFKEQIIKIVEDSNDYGDLESVGRRFFKPFKFSGSSISPEVRFYLGEGFGKGFYLGPFIRFDSYKFSSNYLFYGESENYIIDFDGHFKGFGYGLVLGAQYRIGKHITIDTYIAPYLSDVKIDFHSTSNYVLTDTEVIQLSDDLNSFSLPNGETSIELSNSSAKGELTSKTFPNLRAGLGLGFKF